MADRHPYISGGGALVKAVQQFRSSLPGKIDANVLKKLGLAPKNESFLINILQFIGVITEDGTATEAAREVFAIHEDVAFKEQFAKMVREAYVDLFNLHKDNAWSLDQSGLITYFRHADQTSALVGTRQATTFQTLAALAGHGEIPAARPTRERQAKQPKTAKAEQQDLKTASEGAAASGAAAQRRAQRDLGLTVRIEINLPASGDQETYDRIFKSIRENLLND